MTAKDSVPVRSVREKSSSMMRSIPVRPPSSLFSLWLVKPRDGRLEGFQFKGDCNGENAESKKTCQKTRGGEKSQKSDCTFPRGRLRAGAEFGGHRPGT